MTMTMLALIWPQTWPARHWPTFHCLFVGDYMSNKNHRTNTAVPMALFSQIHALFDGGGLSQLDMTNDAETHSWPIFILHSYGEVRPACRQARSEVSCRGPKRHIQCAASSELKKGATAVDRTLRPPGTPFAPSAIRRGLACIDCLHRLLSRPLPCSGSSLPALPAGNDRERWPFTATGAREVLRTAVEWPRPASWLRKRTRHSVGAH
jgi:hypothetical protein